MNNPTLNQAYNFNDNPLLAILPCAGFGTRVQKYIPEGMYKELACIDNQAPNLVVIAKDLLENVGVDVLVLIHAEKKTQVQWHMRGLAMDLDFKPAGYSTRITSLTPYVKYASRMSVRKLENGKDQMIISISVPNDLHATQNPLDAVMFARYITAPLIVANMRSNWNTLVMFPDIYYTKLDVVMGAIKKHHKHNTGEYAMSSLPTEGVPNLNPEKFGRHDRNIYKSDAANNLISYEIHNVEYASHDRKFPHCTCLETGILYLPYRVLFQDHKPETWIYDLMLGTDSPVYALDLNGTSLVDLGDPYTYIVEDLDNPVEISWSAA